MAPKIMYMWLLYLILLCITLSKAHKVPAIYSFGDSTLDVGNNNEILRSVFKAGYPPNGIDYEDKKATGRFSNGRNCADFIAEKVGLSESPPPYFSLSNDMPFPETGVSFASGGARIVKCPDDSIPLSLQVEYYKIVAVQVRPEETAKTHLSESLFILAIGTNDILYYLACISNANQEAYVKSMLDNLEELIQEMYNYDARKYVVIGSGPLGFIPLFKNEQSDVKEKANKLARIFNKGLKSMLEKMQKKLPGFLFSFLDAYEVVSDSMKSGSGFDEVKVGCCKPSTRNLLLPLEPDSTPCSNRNAHLFWDNYHLTEEASSRFINLVYDGPPKYASPINIQQLVEPVEA